MTAVLADSSAVALFRRFGLKLTAYLLAMLLMVPGSWLMWRYWAEDQPQKCCWGLIIAGLLAAFAAGCLIATFSVFERSVAPGTLRWLICWPVQFGKRLVLVMQIVSTLVAAGAAAALIFGFKLPHS